MGTNNRTVYCLEIFDFGKDEDAMGNWYIYEKNNRFEFYLDENDYIARLHELDDLANKAEFYLGKKYRYSKYIMNKVD